MSDKHNNEKVEPQNVVVAIGDFAKHRQKEAYQNALKKIIERAKKTEW
ncbi:hypothetical protein ACI2KR_09375 [Pseudomonas luteola]